MAPEYNQPYQPTPESQKFGMNHAGETLYPYIANEGLQPATPVQAELESDALTRQAQEAATPANPESAAIETLDAREVSAEIQNTARIIEANREFALNPQESYTLAA